MDALALPSPPFGLYWTLSDSRLALSPDLQENSHALYLHTHRSTGVWSLCANSPLLSALPQAAFALSGMNQAPIHEVPQL